MEKSEAGCFQVLEDDVSMRIDKHQTSSSRMNHFHVLSLSQHPGEDCCCGGLAMEVVFVYFKTFHVCFLFCFVFIPKPSAAVSSSHPHAA